MRTLKTLIIMPKEKWRTQDRRVKNFTNYLSRKDRLGSIYGDIQIDVINIELPIAKIGANGMVSEFELRKITNQYRENYNILAVVFADVEGSRYKGAYYPNTLKNDTIMDTYILTDENSIENRLSGRFKAFERRLEHEIAGHGASLDLGLTNQGNTNEYKVGTDNTHLFFYDKDRGGIDQYYKELNERWVSQRSTFQKILDVFAEAVEKLQKKNSKVKPLAPKHWKNITQGYGVKNPSYKTTGYHIGVDFGCPIGTKIRARENGEITLVGFHKDLGNFCYFKFKGYEERYLHLDKEPVEGKYQQGETIAVTGNTGFSTGTHLHLDTFINKVQKVTKTNWSKITVDPLSI